MMSLPSYRHLRSLGALWGKKKVKTVPPWVRSCWICGVWGVSLTQDPLPSERKVGLRTLVFCELNGEFKGFHGAFSTFIQHAAQHVGLLQPAL